jgi:hypothetical protein
VNCEAGFRLFADTVGSGADNPQVPLWRTLDDPGEVGADSETVAAAVEHPGRSREEALWAGEVAGLLGAAHRLEGPVRTAVTTVLDALVDDPFESGSTRAVVRALQGALETGRGGAGR